MTVRDEMARLVRDELLTLIQPVTLLTVNPERKSGAVSGRFRSNGMLFDYSIRGTRVSYRPSGSRKDSDTAEATEASAYKALGEAWQLAAEIAESAERLDTRCQKPDGTVYGTRGKCKQGRELRQRSRVSRRLDAKRNNKKCSIGYSCGRSCISMEKECVKSAGPGADKLSQLVKGRGSPGTGGGQSRSGAGNSLAERRIAALTARRGKIGKSLVASLSQKRPDGMGNFIENPDSATFQKIKTVKQRVARIDRQLNELEGKEPDAKRWVEGDPLGLGKYSDFQSPGRRAYEQRVIAEELAAGAKGDQAVFMSGGPASGKTSLLRKQFGEAKGFVVVDPDRIKGTDPVMEIGVAMGMRQAAALAHENSSRLSKEVFAAARDNGLNVLMDGTGANADKYIKQMEDLKSKGYQVTLLAQHVPEEVGVKRAMDRADRSGRYVPEEFIKHAYEVIPGNFERLAQVADRATLNDGESNQPIMYYESGRLAGGDRRRTIEYRNRYGKPPAKPGSGRVGSNRR